MARRIPSDQQTASAGATPTRLTKNPTEHVRYSRILVVDPDDDTRQLYRRAFELADFDVIEAADGRDALVKALDRPPSVVVMEVRLPIMDGFALCEILRCDRATTAVPILVVTTEATEDRLQRIRTVGADAVLVKPAELDTILSEAKRLAAGRPDPSDRQRAGGRSGAASKDGDRSSRPHLRQSKAHARFDTIDPPAQPPALHCPLCDAQLVYQYSHVGGVSSRHAEQWDYYTCTSACGGFEYRQRTRKIRRVHGTLPPYPKAAAS